MKAPTICLIGAALLLLTGCQKKDAASATAPAGATGDAVAIVPAKERSRHFEAVNRQLELGGTLYGYADIDGDALKLAGGVQTVLEEVAKNQPQVAPYLKQDVAALLTILGLTDIKAVGLSSVPDGTGYFRNRVYVHTPDGRHGLLAGLGGAPAPFARLHLAPADTDVYSEGEIDLPAVYKTVLEVVAKVGGDASANRVEQSLKMAGQKAAVSVLSIVQNWKGRMAIVMRFEEGPGLVLPGRQPVQLPAFSLLISVDGIAPALRETLLQQPFLNRREENGREIFEPKQPPPVRGLNPLLAIEGSTLMLATSPGFLAECVQAKGGLAQTDAFKQALAPFGDKANGLGYISPRFFARVHDFPKLNPEMPADAQRAVGMVLAHLPKPDRPLVTVRTNLPEGILIRSYWNRSLKQDMVAVSIYNPVSVGLLAAMAIPAFQKVRTASQEKAVLNNLRQLAAAADQYFLETGKESATYADLVGPDKYVRRINPVAGEDYRRMQFRPGQPLQVRLPGSNKVVTYQP